MELMTLFHLQRREKSIIRTVLMAYHLKMSVIGIICLQERKEHYLDGVDDTPSRDESVIRMETITLFRVLLGWK